MNNISNYEKICDTTKSSSMIFFIIFFLKSKLQMKLISNLIKIMILEKLIEKKKVQNLAIMSGKYRKACQKEKRQLKQFSLKLNLFPLKILI